MRMLLCGGFGLALAAAPIAFDNDGVSLGSGLAYAKSGNANSNAGGQSKGKGQDSQQASKTADKTKLTKDNPLHPNNLGRLNGFMHASPQALANASPNSAVGVLSKTYKDALAGYLGLGEDEDVVVTEDDLAAILARAANKPLSPEQIDAINEKLATLDPELDEALDAQPDDGLSETLADLANDIQETEQNQGLGNGDVEDGEDADSEEAESDDGDNETDNITAEVGTAVSKTAETVGDAVVDGLTAAGSLIDGVF
jgi:hypothetical protein